MSKKIGAIVAAAVAAVALTACEPADSTTTTDATATSRHIETTTATPAEYTPDAEPPESVREKAYFDTLREAGIRIADDDALLLGKTVCTYFDEGNTARQLFMEMAVDPYAEQILPVVSNDDLPYAMGAATAAFCPEHQGQFDF